jgi:hypothetical protein
MGIVAVLIIVEVAAAAIIIIILIILLLLIIIIIITTSLTPYNMSSLICHCHNGISFCKNEFDTFYFFGPNKWQTTIFYSTTKI